MQNVQSKSCKLQILACITRLGDTLHTVGGKTRHPAQMCSMSCCEPGGLMRFVHFRRWDIGDSCVWMCCLAIKWGAVCSFDIPHCQEISVLAFIIESYMNSFQDITMPLKHGVFHDFKSSLFHTTYNFNFGFIPSSFLQNKIFSLLVFQGTPHLFDGFYNWFEVTFK